MDDKSLKDFFNTVLDLARKTGMQTCLLMIVDKDGGTSHGGYGHLWHELALLTNCLNSFLQDARIKNEDAAEILRSLVVASLATGSSLQEKVKDTKIARTSAATDERAEQN